MTDINLLMIESLKVWNFGSLLFAVWVAGLKALSMNLRKMLPKKLWQQKKANVNLNRFIEEWVLFICCVNA